MNTQPRTDIRVGDRVRMSCIYNDREVVVLSVDGKDATIRLLDDGRIANVALSVLYT